MSEYNTNETVTMSLERYQGLMDQIEFLESKSVDNFTTYDNSRGKVKITVDTTELESYFKQRYQYLPLCITKYEVEVEYKGDKNNG